ncbi:mechanosensitive ion channel domain-containing protein [Vibrio renipiscarius]|uniref:Small-conductance mechanosensitive channel n=1 Tax=Vibrio renipiscarius TaxID=1461322 RepID=A0A0C2NSI7_9VIBR|nr:mechanosensitive ion channel domain-containing protein [Vibrio renipiscarius]KII77117.1 mechanosensitive ion channel protein MscS [Vibrio renipiscarius]KII77247.1 mechanosensitive ion channel protein MscS [Vibrio renipiscarius]
MSFIFSKPFFLTLVISFFSLSAFAEQATDAPQLSKTELAIQSINQDIVDLSQSLASSTGDERDAIQLQLFQKNEELRTKLASAVSHGGLTEAALLKQISIQKRYASGATEYLDAKIKELSLQIDSAKPEDKLALLNHYRELQQYLDSIYQSNWQNVTWLKKLDKPDEKLEEALRESTNIRLRLLSASVEYFNQQLEFTTTQLATSPESEKASIQLNQLIIKQRLDIATNSMRDLITIGDHLGLSTSEYKRLAFEVTGNITHDLLNTQVILAIITTWSRNAFDWIVDNAPQHLFQLMVFAFILLIAKGLAGVARKLVTRTVSSKNLKMSQLMQDFFVSMSGKAVWVIGIMVGLSQIGLNLAPILTGFGIAGVIIGFALQDTLSNFAAGMMLLIYRPFDVGDFVYAGGVDGKVSHMSLVNTTIRTFDNQIIIVPNSKIWGDVIKNVTHERIRRVDMVFGIGYSDDLLLAESVLEDIIVSHPMVLRTPEPMIKVHTLNTSSIDFIVRPWVKTEDYWDVYWDVTKEVKLRFDREGLSIPFPQQDVHLHMVEKKDA